MRATPALSMTLLAVLSTAACTGTRPASSSGDAGARPDDAAPGEAAGDDASLARDAPPALPYRAVASLLSTRRPEEHPLARRAHIFLVAGSSRAANFAQEVIDQKAAWLAAGYARDEIACYYVVPYQEEFDGDREQFFALASDLADCYPASMKLLGQHMAAAAPGSFLYLYVTGHGERPVSLRLADTRAGERDHAGLLRQARYPVLDEYRISVEALPDGTASDGELVGALRAGMDARDLYLTPAHLAGLLASHDRAAKIVVLQGCFSGGFVDDPRRTRDAEPLASLAGLTVLTAARHDRDSFGCNHGDRRTYYGAAYGDALARVIDRPLAVDWQALHAEVAARVAALEKKQGVRPSLPQFLTTTVAPSTDRPH